MSSPDQAQAPAALGYLLRQAAGAHRTNMDRALSALSVTAPQFLVLTLIAANPGCSNADLARWATLTTPTVSVIVRNLLQAGALFRREHATHGRIHHLDLTSSGAALLERCKAAATPVEGDLECDLTARDIATIRGWLLRALGTR